MITKFKVTYIIEVIKVSLVLEVIGFLKNCLCHIIAILIQHYFLKSFSIFHKKGEKCFLAFMGSSSYCLFNNIRRNFLSAVEYKIFTDKIYYLHVKVLILVFQNLLYHIVSILIIDYMAELSQALLYQILLQDYLLEILLLLNSQNYLKAFVSHNIHVCRQIFSCSVQEQFNIQVLYINLRKNGRCIFISHDCHGD